MMDSWAGPAGFPFRKLCVFTPAELEYGMSLQFFYKEKALHYQEEDANMMTFTANMCMLLKMFKFMHLCVSVGVFVFFSFCFVYIC